MQPLIGVKYSNVNEVDLVTLPVHVTIVNRRTMSDRTHTHSHTHMMDYTHSGGEFGNFCVFVTTRTN